MSSTTKKSYYRQGIVDGLPFLVMAVPFSMLFGVIAVEAGLTLAQTMGFSVVVIAGASQFAAVQLMVENAPIFAILAAALAVNLRMAMYSASLQPYMGAAPLWQRAAAAYVNVDQTYAASVAKFEAEPDMSVPERFAYFFGVVTPIMPAWMIFTGVGAVLGTRLPEALPLDYAMPILFLALVAPMVRTLAHLGAAVTSVLAALAFTGLPSGIGLILAALLAMVVGAEIERRRA